MSTTALNEHVTIPVGTWAVDPAHSSVEFRIKDVRTIVGRFTDFDGSIVVGERPDDLRAEGTIRAGSLSTHEPQRDAHLRSPDFVDAERFPEIRFETVRVEPQTDRELKIFGRLTIKETPIDVVLDATVRGPGQDPYGNERIAIDSRTTIEWGDTAVEIVADVSATKVE